MKTHTLLIICCLLVSCSFAGRDTRLEDPSLAENYQLLSLLNERVDPVLDVVYSPAFRTAWTMLKEDIVKENIQLKQPVPITALLNDSPYRPANEKDWIVRAGLVGDGVLEDIRKSMKTKFNTSFRELDAYKNVEDAIVCFAHFRQSVTFATPFETMTWKFNCGGNFFNVSCFGVTKSTGQDNKEAIRRQVRIYDYKTPDDFIAVINGSTTQKEIILAKMEFTESLQYMWNLVNDRILQGYGEEVDGHDELIVPKIRLNVFHSLDELLGKHLANKGFEKYFFVLAEQKVEFSMDESGASAEATGTIVKMKGPVPRIYAFDKPFLVILRDAGSPEPDLVVWVATTIFLVKSD